jgi:aminoglycoside phosphotransferase (APT) family kinase protein
VTPPLDPAELTALSAWLNASADGVGEVYDVAVLSGGTQNSLLSFRWAGRRCVLRRPPRDDAIARRTVEREAIVLAGLEGSRVPHPRFVARCDDPSILGRPFFVMERVEGVNLLVRLEPPHSDDPAVQRRMGESLVDAVAAVSRSGDGAARRLEPVDPSGWPLRQVAKWARRLEGYASRPGSRPIQLPGAHELGERLLETGPREAQVGLVHGDAHVGNVLFAADGTVTGLLDWELAGLGDPLLDLGQLLAWWPDRTGRHPSLALAGLPSRAEAVDRYLAQTGRSAELVPWYHALACYRLAVLLEGTRARSLAGTAPRVLGERFHVLATALVEQGLDSVSREGSTRCDI